MNGTNKQRLECEVLHSKTHYVFKEKLPFWRLFSKDPILEEIFFNSSGGGTRSRIVEHPRRGLCNDWKRFRGRRNGSVSLDRPWWNIFAPLQLWVTNLANVIVAQSMKSILDASLLLWNVNWSFRRWSKCHVNFYSLFRLFPFQNRYIFMLYLEHWLLDR